MEVGLIGGGRTAAAIAENLLAAGHQLTIFNPPPKKGQDPAPTGATIAKRLRDACNVDAVITVLTSDQRVEEVVLSDGGLAAAMPAGAIHICMSTIGIELSRRLAAAHADRVQRYVAAPVFGRSDAAAKGELCIFVAGRADTISRCQPLFEVMGRQTVEVGPDPAEANLLQLCAIGLVASLFESLRETIVLSERGGIAPERFLKLMSRSVFATGPEASYSALIAAVRAPAVTTAKQSRRRAAPLIETANAPNAKLPLASLNQVELDSLISRGLVALDWLAVATSGGAEGISEAPAADSRSGRGQVRGPPTSA